MIIPSKIFLALVAYIVSFIYSAIRFRKNRFSIIISFKLIYRYKIFPVFSFMMLVERDLAKVEAAGSSPVSRFFHAKDIRKDILFA